MANGKAVTEEMIWHHLWNRLGNERSLARGLSKMGETKFREILKSAIAADTEV